MNWVSGQVRKRNDQTEKVLSQELQPKGMLNLRGRPLWVSGPAHLSLPSSGNQSRWLEPLQLWFCVFVWWPPGVALEPRLPWRPLGEWAGGAEPLTRE